LFQAEDGMRDLVRSRGLGDVYKRQCQRCIMTLALIAGANLSSLSVGHQVEIHGFGKGAICKLYGSAQIN